MRHKIIIIMPSRPSQLLFSVESVSSEMSKPTRDSDSSRSGPRRIRLSRLVSDSAESLNRVGHSTATFVYFSNVSLILYYIFKFRATLLGHMFYTSHTLSVHMKCLIYLFTLFIYEYYKILEKGYQNIDLHKSIIICFNRHWSTPDIDLLHWKFEEPMLQSQ